MNEPDRLLESSADQIELALLRSAGDDEPGPAPHVRQKIALGVSAGLVASTATTGSLALGALAVAKWIGVGAALGGLAVAALSPALRPKPAHVERPLGAPSAPLVARLPLPAAAGIASAEAAPPAAPPRRAAPVVTVEPLPLPPAASTLQDEITALDRARGALNEGDAVGAESALEAYDRAYLARRMGPEADLLRIRVMLAQGRKVEARERASRVLTADPSGPYVNVIEAMFPDLGNKGDQTGNGRPSSQ